MLRYFGFMYCAPFFFLVSFSVAFSAIELFVKKKMVGEKKVQYWYYHYVWLSQPAIYSQMS